MTHIAESMSRLTASRSIPHEEDPASWATEELCETAWIRSIARLLCSPSHLARLNSGTLRVSPSQHSGLSPPPGYRVGWSTPPIVIHTVGGLQATGEEFPAYSIISCRPHRPREPIDRLSSRKCSMHKSLKARDSRATVERLSRFQSFAPAWSAHMCIASHPSTRLPPAMLPAAAIQTCPLRLH
jgi:hypothetical protein